MAASCGSGPRRVGTDLLKNLGIRISVRPLAGDVMPNCEDPPCCRGIDIVGFMESFVRGRCVGGLRRMMELYSSCLGQASCCAIAGSWEKELQLKGVFVVEPLMSILENNFGGQINVALQVDFHWLRSSLQLPASGSTHVHKIDF